jgi:hypothetical protein
VIGASGAGLAVGIALGLALVSMKTARYQVWQSPGGLRWRGDDEEEAVLAALKLRASGVLTEVFEMEGEAFKRRLGRWEDGWKPGVGNPGQG